MTQELDAIIQQFDPISLSEMEGVKLMDRLDAKFTFRVDQFPGILQEMLPHYRVLEVKGARANRYETLYFDTDDFALFARHHSGKFARYKVRFRRYVDSDLCFFEVKAKNNKGRTVKQRIRRDAILRAVEGDAEDLLRQATPLRANDFKPVLWVHFTRFTFVSKTTPERVTIDLNLAYENKAARVDFPKLVIAEVKQDKSSLNSPFIRIMRERRIWQGSMSKYCFGIVNLYPRVKMNLFKERVKQLKLLAA